MTSQTRTRYKPYSCWNLVYQYNHAVSYYVNVLIKYNTGINDKYFPFCPFVQVQLIFLHIMPLKRCKIYVEYVNLWCSEERFIFFTCIYLYSYTTIQYTYTWPDMYFMGGGGGWHTSGIWAKSWIWDMGQSSGIWDMWARIIIFP